MALPQHLEEAAARLQEASYRIDEARAKSLDLESLRSWLDALTAYVLSDIHQLDNESIHEKLHEIAGRTGLRTRSEPGEGAARRPRSTLDPRGYSVPPTSVTLFLCGDVMTGRGVDQVLPYPSDPRLHERSVHDARTYVKLAERANGPIARPVGFAYIWGDALDELERLRPDARIINLETSVTSGDHRWYKGINYRMHPANVPCLTAARIDCCVLANNHVLDWGYAGLLETLDTLRRAGLETSGAGRTLAEAEAPAVIEIASKGRVLVFGFGTETSGIPASWAAAESRPGVHLLENLSDETVERVGAMVRRAKRAGDVVVASIHWGGNWGFAVPEEHVRFAHGLVRAGVDVVHGHSSHHVRPIEIFEGKLILYGCGDFLDDYEGIRGYEQFRDDLTLMYFASVDPDSGALTALRLLPMRIKNFRMNHASREDAGWLRETISRESRRFRFDVALHEDDHLELRPVPPS